MESYVLGFQSFRNNIDLMSDLGPAEENNLVPVTLRGLVLTRAEQMDITRSLLWLTTWVALLWCTRRDA